MKEASKGRDWRGEEKETKFAERERDKGRKKKEIERQFSLLRKGGRKNKYEE